MSGEASIPFYRRITVIEQLEIIAGNNFDVLGVNLIIRYFGINANHEKLLSGNKCILLNKMIAFQISISNGMMV